MENEIREFLNQTWAEHYRTSANQASFEAQVNAATATATSSAPYTLRVPERHFNQEFALNSSSSSSSTEPEHLISTALSKVTNSLSTYMSRASALPPCSQQDLQPQPDLVRKYAQYGLVHRDAEFGEQQKPEQQVSYPFGGGGCAAPPPDLIGIKEMKAKAAMASACQRPTGDHSRPHSRPIESPFPCSSPFGALSHGPPTSRYSGGASSSSSVAVVASSTSINPLGKPMIIGNSSSGGGFVSPAVDCERRASERSEVADSSTPPPSSTHCISSSSVAAAHTPPAAETDKKSANSIRGTSEQVPLAVTRDAIGQKKTSLSLHSARMHKQFHSVIQSSRFRADGIGSSTTSRRLIN